MQPRKPRLALRPIARGSTICRLRWRWYRMVSTHFGGLGISGGEESSGLFRARRKEMAYRVTGRGRRGASIYHNERAVETHIEMLATNISRPY